MFTNAAYQLTTNKLLLNSILYFSCFAKTLSFQTIPMIPTIFFLLYFPRFALQVGENYKVLSFFEQQIIIISIRR